MRDAAIMVFYLEGYVTHSDQCVSGALRGPYTHQGGMGTVILGLRPHDDAHSVGG